MKYIATYYNNTIYGKEFNTIEDIENYNKNNNIKNHNLDAIYTLDEIVKDGWIVCIEGDENIEDRKLSKALEKYPKYLLLNNIYENPNKLAELKELKIDVLVIQSTGIRREEIASLQKQYIEKIGIYPKNIICVLGEEDEFLYPLIKSAPFEINIFNHPYVENENIVLNQWIGTDKQKELYKETKK